MGLCFPATITSSPLYHIQSGRDQPHQHRCLVGLLWCPGLGLWASPIAPEPGDLTAYPGLGNMLRAITITVGAPQV